MVIFSRLREPTRSLAPVGKELPLGEFGRGYQPQTGGLKTCSKKATRIGASPSRSATNLANASGASRRIGPPHLSGTRGLGWEGRLVGPSGLRSLCPRDRDVESARDDRDEEDEGPERRAAYTR